MIGRVYSSERIASPNWSAGTTLLPVGIEGDRLRRFWTTWRNLLSLGRLVSADDAVILTDDVPLTANLYGLWQRGRARRPTIVRTDPLFVQPRSALKRTYLAACLRPVDRVVVWAPAVIDRYHHVLDIPREKMVAVRFHHTLQGYQVAASSGDYVFSGGHSMRDYPTLLQAVRGLSIPVRIATHWQPPAGLAVPANVRLGPTSPDEFRALLAGARLVVFPLRTDLLRTSGQQSYLNAMALGKAVIVTDPDDAGYYIDDQRTGRLVPSGDAAALREAICHLLDAPALAAQLGAEARQFAQPLDQEYTWGRVLALTCDIHRQRQREVLEKPSLALRAPVLR
jgi:glycosyltransferase involved in cell wall biosynthesis